MLLKDGNKYFFSGKLKKKTSDLPNPGKWQQLAILNITYKISTRMVYKRVKPTFEAQQCKGQIGFRSSVGVDDAFAVFENVCLQSVWSGLSRCGVQVWICGKRLIVLNTTRCFDALKVHGVPFAYLKLVPSLYHDQVGLVQGRQFPIKRSVKQGDVLRPLLFNPGLDHAIRKLKFRVQHC